MNGKGMEPVKGYNPKNWYRNVDDIDWGHSPKIPDWKRCETCNVRLEFCKAGSDVWSTDHLACPVCNGTYPL